MPLLTSLVPISCHTAIVPAGSRHFLGEGALLVKPLRESEMPRAGALVGDQAATKMSQVLCSKPERELALFLEGKKW